MTRGFITGLGLTLMCLSLPVAAGSMTVKGHVECIDSVSGPGESVVQNADCTSTHSSNKGEKTSKGVSGPSKKAAKVVANQKHPNFECKNWSQLGANDVVLDNGPTAKAPEVLVLVAYVRGALDAQKCVLDREMWDAVESGCADHPEKNIAEILAVYKPQKKKEKKQHKPTKKN